MRRAGLARRLLEEKGALDWVDASRYAPWTLRWSPSLLKLILDLAPAGEPLGCCHRFTRTGGDWKICTNATLLTVAAALDDIESVELLLQYGYDVAPEPNQYGQMLPDDMRHRYYAHREYDMNDPDRYYMHSTLPLDISDISMDHTLFLIPTAEGAGKGLIPLTPVPGITAFAGISITSPYPPPWPAALPAAPCGCWNIPGRRPPGTSRPPSLTWRISASLRSGRRWTWRWTPWRPRRSGS